MPERISEGIETMGLTSRERLRREVAAVDVANDAAADLDELGDDAAFAFERIANPLSERDALKVRIRFHCLTLARMIERGQSSDAGMTYVQSITDETERTATITAFNAGIRG